MPGRDGAPGVSSGVMEDTPVGPLAVWVTRHGVRRVGFVQQDMIDEGHWDPADDEILAQAFKQLGEYLAGRRKLFELPLDCSGATVFRGRSSSGSSTFRTAASSPTEISQTSWEIRGRPVPSDRLWEPTLFLSSCRATVWCVATESWAGTRGTEPQGHPPRDRGCGRRRAAAGESGASRGAAAAALASRGHGDQRPGITGLDAPGCKTTFTAPLRRWRAAAFSASLY